MADGEFRNLGGGSSKDIVEVIHNERDLERYQDRMDRMEKRYRVLELQRAKVQRERNLAKWDAKQVAPWDKARIGELKDEDAAREAVTIQLKHRWTSLFVTGPSGSGKTFLALAMVRRFIGHGLVAPHQVSQISEQRMLSNLKIGYQGHQEIKAMMDSGTRLFVVENVGSRSHYNDNELALWESFLDHAASQNIAVFFTSQKTAAEFDAMLSDSASSKFSHMVAGRIVTMSGVVKPPTLDERASRVQGSAPKPSATQGNALFPEDNGGQSRTEVLASGKFSGFRDDNRAARGVKKSRKDDLPFGG